MLSAQSVRLSPTSYVVLGSIALRGPSTSYDLKRFVELAIGHFWLFPHSQLYAEPERLARAGLLSEVRERGGRRRRTYAIREAGLRAVHDWLGEPSPDSPELRDLGLLKLFYTELVDEDVFQSLVLEQAALHRSLLERYQWLWRRYGNRPEYANRVLALQAGLHVEQALVSFWEQLAGERAASQPQARS